MSKMPPMNGMYNIQQEGADGYIHYQSVPKLPTFSEFEDECEGIADLLRNVIGGYLQDKGFPKYNSVLEDVFDDNDVGEFPSDRTMCFFVNDLNAFSPDFVRVLQDRVLTEYPLWRLVAQYEEKQIGVYPHGAWLGDQLIEGDFDEDHPAYRAWWEDASTFREAKFGPVGRQIAYVRQLIPAAIPRAKGSGFSVLASFDRFQPRYPGLSIWLLQSTAVGELSIDEMDDESHSDCWLVGEEGTIYDRFWQDLSVFRDGVAPFQLKVFVVKPASSHELVLKNSLGGVVGSVRVTEVILDNTLRDA